MPMSIPAEMHMGHAANKSIWNSMSSKAGSCKGEVELETKQCEKKQKKLEIERVRETKI